MWQQSRIFDMKAHEERLDAIIRKSYLSSFMSNTSGKNSFRRLGSPSWKSTN